MMELSALRVDPSKSLDGTWIDYMFGTRLLVARFDNKKMQTYKTGRIMEHKDLFKDIEKNQEEAMRVSEEIDVECLAHFVLLDWEGFSKGGEPLAYTPELGIEIFSDENYSEFRDFVRRVAQNTENYRVESEAVVAELVKDPAAS